ncbi:hypothetical protein BO78DRAFT_178749 [Aspergillus sclerotiicarbonarius CBS 121057]|uniref:Uncharacterized protein n=1 Tax=Aspergillus sclerotiicarbonarius (strain CBS 121057 / IBT 28362) TaxID=1448318 RepID=A0A319EJW9_ASPSB|nr:hypothetical protein BO78DRAFT_178749 [Aspergillus sclerotiicarbonarius CBS 121057]
MCWTNSEDPRRLGLHGTATAFYIFTGAAMNASVDKTIQDHLIIYKRGRDDPNDLLMPVHLLISA